MSSVDQLHDLSGRYIFLTGGTGSVGRTLIDYLAACEARYGGMRVVIVTRDAAAFATRFPNQARHHWLTLLKGSLADLPALPEGTTDVIHAAADTHLGSGYAGWVDQIIGGTRVVLEASAAHGIDRFLLLSSGAVYGPQPSLMARMPEDYAGAPDPRLLQSTYGQAKRVSEQLCTIFHREHGLATVAARLFAFGSPHIPRDSRYALGSFIRDATTKTTSPIEIAGDGTAVRSYLTGRDMAHALITALLKGDAGQVYNIGSDEPVTIAELAHRVRDRLSPYRRIIIHGTPGDGQRSLYVPDVSRIAALGAASRSDLDAVIADAAGGRGNHEMPA